jgi:acetyltransferase-like isoleucine patch superfamily enzyme
LRWPSLPWDTTIRRPYRIDGDQGLTIGKSVVFQAGVWLFCGKTNDLFGKLQIGDNCSFGYRNHITSVEEVIIGANVLTANNVYISDNLHGYENIEVPIISQPVKFKKRVEIGSGSWIGENVSIIGASIGKNSVIGANSVVTSDIPDYSVAVGAPARVIKKFNQDTKLWEREE